MTWADLQPVATSLAGIGAIAAVALGAAGDHHPLRLVERLTAIATDISDVKTRRLIEDYRDERAVTLVLTRRAPALHALRWGTWTLWIAAGVCFAFWLLTAFTQAALVIGWCAYAIGLASSIAGRLLFEARRTRRKKWMDQELSWRGMEPMPVAELVASRRAANVEG